MIKHIFLDAGGVILDETRMEQQCNLILCTLVGEIKDYHLTDLYADLADAVAGHVPDVHDFVLFRHFPGPADFRKARERFQERRRQEPPDLRLMDGLPALLDRLAPRYRLGIMGQYGPELRDFLAACGLLDRFTWPFVRPDFALTKPDPRYYSQVLAAAGCHPACSLMLGDRIDKDIAPARTVGMVTVLHRTGLHRDQQPRLPGERPHATIRHLDQLDQTLLDRLESTQQGC